MTGLLAFKLNVWGRLSWQRVAAVVLIALLGLLAPHVTALVLSGCAAAVLVGVVVADYAQTRSALTRIAADTGTMPS